MQVTTDLSKMPRWPAALTFDEVLIYSRLSESEIRRASKRGELAFKPLGSNGRMIIPRSHVDDYLAKLFADPAIPSAPFDYSDFGDD